MAGATEQSLDLTSEIIMVFSRTGRCSDECGFQSDCSGALRTGRPDVRGRCDTPDRNDGDTQEVKVAV